jgi:hypothetical protein
MDSSHTPGAAYLPYLLTGDPYYLEALQALATYSICCDAYARIHEKLPGLVTTGQTRGFAWCMRFLFQAGAVTPDNAPSWLLPRSYWRKAIVDNRTYMQRFMDSPARLHKVFRTFTRSDMLAGWQNSFVTFILAWGVELGYGEWRDALQWFAEGQIAQADGKSGWDRRYPTPYYWHPLKTWRQHIPLTLVPDTSLDGETCADWADAFAFYLAEGKIPQPPVTGNAIIERSPDYLLNMQAALRYAKRVGVTGAEGAVAYLDAQVPGAMAANKWLGETKWSVIAD